MQPENCKAHFRKGKVRTKRFYKYLFSCSGEGFCLVVLGCEGGNSRSYWIDERGITNWTWNKSNPKFACHGCKRHGMIVDILGCVFSAFSHGIKKADETQRKANQVTERDVQANVCVFQRERKQSSKMFIFLDCTTSVPKYLPCLSKFAGLTLF